jgi:hypothetical protein
MGYNRENIRDKRPRNTEKNHAKPKITPKREHSKEDKSVQNTTQITKNKDEKRNRKSNQKNTAKDFKDTELNGPIKVENGQGKLNEKSDETHKPKERKQRNKDEISKNYYNSFDLNNL